MGTSKVNHLCHSCIATVLVCFTWLCGNRLWQQIATVTVLAWCAANITITRDWSFACHQGSNRSHPWGTRLQVFRPLLQRTNQCQHWQWRSDACWLVCSTWVMHCCKKLLQDKCVHTFLAQEPKPVSVQNAQCRSTAWCPFCHATAVNSWAGWVCTDWFCTLKWTHVLLSCRGAYNHQSGSRWHECLQRALWNDHGNCRQKGSRCSQARYASIGFIPFLSSIALWLLSRLLADCHCAFWVQVFSSQTWFCSVLILIGHCILFLCTGSVWITVCPHDLVIGNRSDQEVQNDSGLPDTLNDIHV